MKTVVLTDEQWKMLLGILERYDDCGPTNEGWQSLELADAVDAIRNASTGDPER